MSNLCVSPCVDVGVAVGVAVGVDVSVDVNVGVAPWNSTSLSHDSPVFNMLFFQLLLCRSA